MGIVCCQVEFSTTARSLIQRNTTECGVSEWNLRTSAMMRYWRNRGCWAMKKSPALEMFRFKRIKKIAILALARGWSRKNWDPIIYISLERRDLKPSKWRYWTFGSSMMFYFILLDYISLTFRKYNDTLTYGRLVTPKTQCGFRKYPSLLTEIFILISNSKHHCDWILNHILFAMDTKYRDIRKSLRDFRTRLRNNQDRHGRTEHINR